MRNFDISYISNRVTSKWPDDTNPSNIQLKNAFNTLLRQAKDTEERMQELLNTYNHDKFAQYIHDSTDERCVRAETPTDYANIGKIFIIITL